MDYQNQRAAVAFDGMDVSTAVTGGKPVSSAIEREGGGASPDGKTSRMFAVNDYVTFGVRLNCTVRIIRIGTVHTSRVKFLYSCKGGGV